MAAAALYILTGITLFASGQHLLLRLRAQDRQPHLWLAGMYLLLSGFALASALTYQAQSPLTLLSAGRFSITLGILLWGTLIWFVALRSGFRPLLLLDALSAAWIALLIKNSIASNSLLYADGSILTRPAVSPWWNVLELTVLASLAFTLYASYRLYRGPQRPEALALAGGLTLLALTAAYDHLVNTGVSGSLYLAPFGFLGFLLVNSLAPQLQVWLARRKPAPVIYNLTYEPGQATFHTDVSELRIPVPPAQGADEPGEPEPGDTTPSPEPAADSGNTDIPPPEPEPQEEPAAPTVEAEAEAPEARKPAPLDQETLNIISDNLIDIAVYATMANNRFKRGDADPQVLQALCKKVRTRAIKTRRLVSKLSDPD